MRASKKSLVLALCILVELNNIYAQWTKINIGNYPHSYTNWWTDLSFLNADTGIVVGGGDLALQTFDGGIHWHQLQNLQLQKYEYIESVKYISADDIYLGTYSRLLRSIDGGFSWFNIMPVATLVSYMDFPSKDIGYVVDWGRTIIASILDGGNQIHWFSSSGFNEEIRVVQAINNDTIYTFGNEIINTPDLTSVLKSVNAGIDWTIQKENIVFGQGFYMVNDSAGYILTDSLLFTTDSWNTYKVIPSDSTLHVHDFIVPQIVINNLYFFNIDTGFVIRPTSEVLFTKDGGLSFQDQYYSNNIGSVGITKIDCPDDNTCFGIVGYPYIARFDFDSSFTLPSGVKNEILDYNLSVSPNPNHGFFTLNLPQSHGAASLIIYDLSGRILWQRDYANPVFPTLSIDLSGTAAGLYLIAWQTADKRYYGKVLIE